MIQEYSIWKVLRVFFDDPLPDKGGFTIRYISKQIGLAPTSVRIHLNELCSQKEKGYPLVIKSEGISYPVYNANRSSELFRFYKKMDILFRLEESGLIERISDELSPKTIILFGSASRGEDLKESDIDLFVLAKEKEIKLDQYEKYIKRKISLHYSTEINKLPKELRNNVINGVIVRGYLKVY